MGYTMSPAIFGSLEKEIAALCRTYAVKELSLFGSFQTDKFRDDSDIDLLVEFQPNARVGFLAFSRMQREMSALLGRRVDLVPKTGLKERIRGEVLLAAQVIYAA